MQKLRKWLFGSQRWKTWITSFTSWMVELITTGRSAGSKQENQEEPKSSYLLYDTCDKCPLRVYIDLVCNDNVRALIIKGEPSELILKAVRIALVSEFAELSGNGQSSAVNISVGKINLYRAQITGFTICLFLISNGQTENALPFLNMNGIRGDNNLIAKIQSRIKNRQVRLKEEVKRYQSFTSQGGGEKPSTGLFTDQLVALSRHVGFRLTTEITLAEYAAYLKDMKQELESLKQINYGKYHK